MNDLNKNAPEPPKIIEWAFLCAHAELDDRGGVNATHIYDKFNLSELPLHLVFRIRVPWQNHELGGLQTYPWLGEFSLGIIIKTDAKEDMETYAPDLLVTDQIRVMLIGQKLFQPGHYTVEISVDGALQHSLDLFLR